jgi:hypothetical protein
MQASIGIIPVLPEMLELPALGVSGLPPLLLPPLVDGVPAVFGWSLTVLPSSSLQPKADASSSVEDRASSVEFLRMAPHFTV